jgi:DNA modification methylase
MARDLDHATEAAITEQGQILEEWYSGLERVFEKTDRHQDPQVQKLVSSEINLQLPVHRWYTLKEAFSAQFPMWVIDHITNKHNLPVERVLDPFLGGGTTGVALAQAGVDVVGIEYNPFIRLVSQVKSEAEHVNIRQVRHFITRINWTHLATNNVTIPALSTLHNAEYFRPSDIATLLGLANHIQSSKLRRVDRRFLLVGVASAIDSIVNLRKDGRALRYVEKPDRPVVSEAIYAAWSTMLDDLADVHFTGEFEVLEGTATRLDQVLRRSACEGLFDAVLCSPPYLNNFDYSEVYKLELWLLGFIQSYSQWRELRSATIRSHHSVKFHSTNYLASNPATYNLSRRLADMVTSPCLGTDEARHRMGPVILGYFDDMYLAFKQVWRTLRPGGILTYVVANSRHGFLPVATDVLLGEIAQHIGFEPLEIIILKQRNGRTRQKRFLRESVVIMRKPETSDQ